MNIEEHLNLLKKYWERTNQLDEEDFKISDVLFKVIILSSLPLSWDVFTESYVGNRKGVTETDLKKLMGLQQLSVFSKKNIYKGSFNLIKERSPIILIIRNDHWRIGSVLPVVQVLHIWENLASIAARIITIPYTANILDLVDVPSVESLDIQVTGVGKEIKDNKDCLDKGKEE